MLTVKCFLFVTIVSGIALAQPKHFVPNANGCKAPEMRCRVFGRPFYNMRNRRMARRRNCCGYDPNVQIVPLPVTSPPPIDWNKDISKFERKLELLPEQPPLPAESLNGPSQERARTRDAWYDAERGGWFTDNPEEDHGPVGFDPKVKPLVIFWKTN